MKALEGEFQAYIRSDFLARRHSYKLTKILESLNFETNKYQSSRVNESTGKILNQRKKHARIPTSIIGYADWLYSRRSAIVHSGKSSKISEKDISTLNKNYKVKCAVSVKIVLSTIKNSKAFYSDLVEEIQKLM